MNDLSLKERLERAAAARASALVPSGSPAMVNLRWDPDATTITLSISAMQALTKRHLNIVKAKRAVEAALAERQHYFAVPKVENPAALQAELEAAGFIARVLMQDEAPPDTKALREKLGHTQEQFAARYRISLDVLQNWEQHVNEPTAIARNFLEMIARDPKRTEQLLWDEL